MVRTLAGMPDDYSNPEPYPAHVCRNCGRDMLRSEMDAYALSLDQHFQMDRDRMAHLPAFVFNSAPASWHRHQSAAGSVAAFIGAIDP